jgi:hypothetical protein
LKGGSRNFSNVGLFALLTDSVLTISDERFAAHCEQQGSIRAFNRLGNTPQLQPSKTPAVFAAGVTALLLTVTNSGNDRVPSGDDDTSDGRDSSGRCRYQPGPPERRPLPHRLSWPIMLMQRQTREYFSWRLPFANFSAALRSAKHDGTV